ncbi:hypothetical protein BKA70DRAFT_1405251 [Coprinopsis sp. MPI-PUGE-AT-0042]|nr:hypothetical protein BKA70DRAFT_1405251 [Coprinopsis sp. MPI-PUGE-AT-0042]
MESEGDVDPIFLSLSLGALLMYTSLISLHIYLCIHSFVKYQQYCALDVSGKARHINYVRAMFLILFLSVATFAFDLAYFYLNGFNNSGRTKEELVRISLYLDVFYRLSTGCTHLTADGILVWRCYVIWAGDTWVGLAPLLPYAASIAVGILSIFSNALCPGRDPTNAICKNHGSTLHRGLYYFVATSVNLTATLLICVRLLCAKRWMKRVLGSAAGSSNSSDAATITTERVGDPVVPYTRIAIVLIESALPFTLLGIAAAIVASINTSLANYARIFTSQLWTMASGLTAQVIIYRVVAGTSWTASGREGDRYALSHSINFMRTSSSSGARSGIHNDVLR